MTISVQGINISSVVKLRLYTQSLRLILIFSVRTCQFVTYAGYQLIMGHDGVCDRQRCPSCMISTFVIPFLKSIISKLATREIPIFLLVSLAEETGFESHIVGNPGDRFCPVEARN